MPLRAKITNPNVAKMTEATATPAQTGIKVIIVGAGTYVSPQSLYNVY
jgi:hypothetical protein